MKDGIIKKTGNSRYLKSAIPADITHEQLVGMLIAGTFPIDLNGINPEGWQQIGDALGKGNLLDDVTCDLLGISRKSVPNDAFIRLGMPTGYHAFGITVTVDGKPLPNVLVQGVTTFAGAPVYADGSGRAIGMSTSDTVTITVDGFLDLQPYYRSFTVSAETIITELNVAISKKSVARVRIDTSQTLLLSDFVSSYDLFLVGGGASGGVYVDESRYNVAGGGAAGYTFTELDITNNGDKLELTIGSGGVISIDSWNTRQEGKTGGTTSVKNVNTGKIFTAEGGLGGSVGSDDARGGNGGSGGGGVRHGDAGDGGSDGSDGGSIRSGTGQKTTTREFGEPTGALYSGAGGGAGAEEDSEGSGGPGGGADGSAGSLGIGGYTRISIADFYGGAGGGIAYENSYGKKNKYKSEGYQGCVVIRWRWAA